MRTPRAFLPSGIGLLSVAILASPAIASDSKGGFALHGVGAQTCQMMLQELKPTVSAASATPAAVMPAPAPLATASAAAPTAASSAASPAAPATAANASAPAPAAGAPAASPIAATPVTSTAAAPAAPGMRSILTSWIMGYLTASDRLVKDTFDQTPVMAPEALTTMIIGVCSRNPDARVETVANNVFTQLAPARVQHDSPVMEARSGDSMVLIRKATLVAMQTNLVKNKLMKDPADGTFGNSTSTALRAFQKSQNLPATGLPDASTVVRMLIEMPSK